MKTLLIVLCALLLGITQMKSDTLANQTTEELNVESVREWISIVGDIYPGDEFTLGIPSDATITDWSSSLDNLRHGNRFRLNIPGISHPSDGSNVRRECLIGRVYFTDKHREEVVINVYANVYFR